MGHQHTLYLKTSTNDQLEALCKKHGMGKSALIRMLIEHENER